MTTEARADLAAQFDRRAKRWQFLAEHETNDARRADYWAMKNEAERCAELARAASPPHTGGARVERIIGICRNPAAPFYWDADRIGEPCPGCACWSDDINPPNHQHEFYVQVEPASDNTANRRSE